MTELIGYFLNTWRTTKKNRGNKGNKKMIIYCMVNLWKFDGRIT